MQNTESPIDTQKLVGESRSKGVLTLTLNFNEANVATAPALQAFAAALDRAAADRDVRVLIIRSAHEKFFCTGLDPLLFLDLDRQTIHANWVMINEVWERLLHFERPTIAVVSGHCMALGAVWACSCDFRVMTTGGGRFAFSEAVISMNFPSLATEILRDIVGNATARRLLYSGKGLKPEQALEVGLVDLLTGPDGQSRELERLTSDLARLTLEAAQGMKRSLNRKYRDYMAANADFDLEELVNTSASANAQEGFRSLLEKRRPNFPQPQ